MGVPSNYEQEYREVLLNALAFLGFKSIKQVERMPLAEYHLRMEAYQIQEAKRKEDIALLAWQCQAVKATKGSDRNPQPYYDTFKDFYDREAMVDSIRESFEAGYQGNSTKSKQKRQRDLIIERQKEWREKMTKEEKDEWVQHHSNSDSH